MSASARVWRWQPCRMKDSVTWSDPEVESRAAARGRISGQPVNLSIRRNMHITFLVADACVCLTAQSHMQRFTSTTTCCQLSQCVF